MLPAELRAIQWAVTGESPILVVRSEAGSLRTFSAALSAAKIKILVRSSCELRDQTAGRAGGYKLEPGRKKFRVTISIFMGVGYSMET